MNTRHDTATPSRLQARGAVAQRRPAVPVVAGAGVAAAALAGFGGLVDGVSEHADLASYDPGITSSVASLRMPSLTFAAEVVTTVGSEVSIGLLTLVTLGWLWFIRRDRPRAVLFAGTMGAGGAVTLVVKHLLSRHRPPATYVVGPVDTGYSFPSGHTVYSTVFLGLLVTLVLWPRLARMGRVAAVLGWAVGSFAIGASRVYLGYHWTTDVIAGWVLAVAVLATALAVAAGLRTWAGSSLPRVRRALRIDDGEGASHASPAR